MHLRNQEFFKNLKEADEEDDAVKEDIPKDNMKSLCRDIIDQQMWVLIASHICLTLTHIPSYYPMFPTPKEMSHELNLDVSHLELASFPTGKTGEEDDEKVIPDILILPSMLKHFIKKVDQTICINPYYSAKGKNSGTFAHLSIHPMNKQELAAQDNQYIQHNIIERCRIDIVNI